MKIKVGKRVADWLDGAGLGEHLTALNLSEPGQLIGEQLDNPEDEWDVAMLILKIRHAPNRADGSCYPDLTKREIQELAEWSEYFANAAADDASEAGRTGEMGGLADLNAARAQIRRCQTLLADWPTGGEA